MPTRRAFLVNCSVLSAVAAFSPAAAWGVSFSSREVSLDSISLAAFIQQMNTVFTVLTGEGAAVKLELAKVQAPPPAVPSSTDAPDAANEKFSLTFRGPLDQPLTQDTYWFDQPAIGRFAMFIVPIVVVGDLSRCYYEAIFNRPARSLPADSRPRITFRYNRRTSGNSRPF